jgi:hypothetical protein
MKHLLILFSLLASPLIADIERCLDALKLVESGWRSDHATCVGDGGKAVGSYQIHPITVREANRIAGYELFSLEDRKSYAKSRELARYILAWHKKRNPRLTDVQLMSKWHTPYGRCPSFYVRKCEVYYRKVR